MGFFTNGNHKGNLLSNSFSSTLLNYIFVYCSGRVIQLPNYSSSVATLVTALILICLA